MLYIHTVLVGDGLPSFFQNYQGDNMMKPTLAYINPMINQMTSLAVIKQKSDVQSLWRKRGWRAPSEYRNDFETSCRPAILSGMVKLELVKLHPVE